MFEKADIKTSLCGHHRLQLDSPNGYTLVELMVVVMIVVILATGVVFMFANPSATVKTQAFNILGEINMARSEAVSENQDVLIDFLQDVSEECTEDDISKCSDAGDYDGYIICLDDDAGGFCNTGDTIIRVTLFNEVVQFYDLASLGSTPADGPSTDPNGVDLTAQDGIVLTADQLIMYSNGTCNQAGTVVIYLPETGNPGNIRGVPYAIVIESASTGRVQVSRWHPESGGSWSSK